ncbi:hypothetical protein D9619_002316 [Psilocybe cf. subviscida]|uniref:GCM domain-containing protein n=1 Tax=Psilocybe cf. subviscida TaxID=2480587 RepID=A0A8H5EUI5_9AGAR|nr:hypothetical protein D9619_002316 [Psilocybe cf. subviscida]
MVLQYILSFFGSGPKKKRRRYRPKKQNKPGNGNINTKRDEVKKDGDKKVDEECEQPALLKDLVPVYSQTGDHIIGYITSHPLPQIPTGVPPQVAAIPLPQVPPASHAGSTPNTAITTTQLKARNTEKHASGPVEWDGWPNGDFELELTYTQFKDTGDLACHWATKGSGSRTGSENATEPRGGRLLTKKCLGVIECDNPQCHRVERAHVRPKDREAQLERECACGSIERIYIQCKCKSWLYKWAEGVYYIHQGIHDHKRPGQVLHLLPEERRRFEDIVQQNPDARPSALVTGPPGIDGPQESVAKISPLLINADRVAKERDKVKNIPSDGGGDQFIKAFADFDRDHPGFVVGSKLGDVTVISFQTPTMESILIKPDLLEKPVNGIVSDATHKWFKDGSSFLIVSSVYCPELSSWAPVLMSFSNGQTTEHFRYHFKALFRIIAKQAVMHAITLNDNLFAMVMDFSEAERLGFIQAFVDFWQDLNDGRFEEELKKAAMAILRGCREHFRANVIRVSKISKFIDIHKADSFRVRALGLLDLPSTEDFTREAKRLIRDFPEIEPWLSWWIRPEHASILCSSERTMDPVLWDLLPATTNAEEAMHFRFYRAGGTNHAFLKGLKGLWAIADMFQEKFKAVKAGGLIRYGKAEKWQEKARKPRTQAQVKDAVIAHSNRVENSVKNVSQSSGKRKRYVNDGRGYDTIKKLTAANTKQKQGKQKNPIIVPASSSSDEDSEEDLELEKDSDEGTPERPPKRAKLSLPKPGNSSSQKSLPPPVTDPFLRQSYPWQNNSCWLDTSLQMLYITLQFSGTTEFHSVFDQLPNTSALQQLNVALTARINLPDNLVSQQIATALRKHQLALRRFLKSIKAIRTLSSFDPLLCWALELASEDGGPGSTVDKDVTFRPLLFFKYLEIDIGYCTGSSEIRGDHIELMHTPRLQNSMIQIGESAFQKYKGSITNVAANLFQIPPLNPARWGCWRQKELKPLCPGRRQDRNNIIVCPPMFLSFEFASDVTLEPFDEPWDIPAEISPSVEGVTPEDGITYKLTSLALLAANRTHFTTRYTSKDRKTIYFYDGCRNSGRPEIEEGATFETHMIGSSIPVPKGALGGLKAQDRFFELRQKELTKMSLVFSSPTLRPFSVEYRAPGYTPLAPRQRTWLRNPTAAKTTEYVTLELQEKGPGSPAFGPLPEGDDGFESEESIPLASLKSHTNPSEQSMAKSYSALCVGTGPILRANEKAEQIDSPENSGKTVVIIAKPKSQRALTQYYKKVSLSERLCIGMGALAQSGEFWYPVRLIDRVCDKEKGVTEWRIKWWKGCQSSSGDVVAGVSIMVNEKRVIDSLYGKREERRKIRLGKWAHAVNSPTAEDIADDPEATPYTPVVHSALSGAVQQLKLLLSKPDHAGLKGIPSKTWLENSKKRLTSVIPFSGGLSLVEIGEISNWFEVHVAGNDRKLRHRWATGLPIAHARTVYIARRDYPCIDGYPSDDELESAWCTLAMGDVPVLPVDVDREAVSALEELMFERSLAAGVAGYCQWGLDAGDHEEDWHPYGGLPSHWNHENRDDSESEIQPGPNYITIERAKAPEPPKQPRPKPRLRKPVGIEKISQDDIHQYVDT